MAAPKRRPRKPATKAQLAAKEIELRKAERDLRKGQAMAMMGADPTLKVAEVAARCGLSKAQINGIRSQMKRDLLPATEVLRAVTQQEILGTVEDRLIRSIEAITPEKLRQAPVRDAAYSADRLFNMRQLMRGEPTSILSIEDRRQINELGNALLIEMKKRGVTLEGEATVIEGPA